MHFLIFSINSVWIENTNGLKYLIDCVIFIYINPVKEAYTMRLQESGEMYLETIYVLSKKISTVRSIDVGEYMGYSKPSVSRAIGLLKNGGYVSVDPDGYLTLTDAGNEVASKIYERHTLLTECLMRLGVDKERAAEDACKIEHDISDESFEAIKRHLER